MSKIELLTVQEFARLSGKKPQTIYKQLNNRLNPYVQLVNNQKMLKASALTEVFGIAVDQPIQPELNNSFNPETAEEIIFLRSQVEYLQQELLVERQHNRDKDKQLLDTLAALATGQVADKQKALAETVIEGQRIISESSSSPPAPEEPRQQGWFTRLFKK